MKETIIGDGAQEKALETQLEDRTDIKAQRVKRLLALPDLTKKEHSPIKILADRITALPRFADFDLVEFPRVVSVADNFDVLNSPKDHPSRRETDTYYADPSHVLRTHTTTMWPYYLRNEQVLARLQAGEAVGALSKGIVFRKDEIDRKHFPAFHQIDGLYICRKDQKQITQKDLEDVLVDIAKSVFGDTIEYKFAVDSFPFTDPSVEMNLKFNGDWLEILGAGLVHRKVLENFGLDPALYNGWAFGFGLERLAMVKFEIPDIRILWSDDPRITSQFTGINSKFKEVSKYPAVERDISFIISKYMSLNNYYELVRDVADNLIEEVKMTDEYENDEKFGSDKKSYTFKIIYQSHEKTLTNEEVNKIQSQIEERTKTELNATVR